MTEKRFEMIITSADGSFYYLDKNTGEKITSTLELENKLNALHEENEQLKKQIERIDFILDDLNGAEYISRDDGIKALNKIDKVIGKR